MFDSDALVRFYTTNVELPHVSKYHRESYPAHALLVVDAMARWTDKPELLLAAALHDIAKPRTVGTNKRGEVCFYGHEDVTDEELSRFLSQEHPCYEKVKKLIRCHMVPYKILDPTNFDRTLRKMCRKILGYEPDEAFIEDVILLHEADDAGTIRRDEDLAKIDQRCYYGLQIIRSLR